MTVPLLDARRAFSLICHLYLSGAPAKIEAADYLPVFLRLFSACFPTQFVRDEFGSSY